MRNASALSEKKPPLAIASFMYKQIKSRGAVFSCVNQSRTTEAYQELWAHLK